MWLHLQCLYALHRIEGAISQRLNVVIVKRQQAEAVQIAKGILAYTGDFIGIQQEKLQWCKSFKYAWGQILYFIAIEHAKKMREREKRTNKKTLKICIHIGICTIYVCLCVYCVRQKWTCFLNKDKMYDIKWYKTIVWAIVADEAICVVGRVWVCVCVNSVGIRRKCRRICCCKEDCRLKCKKWQNTSYSHKHISKYVSS